MDALDHQKIDYKHMLKNLYVDKAGKGEKGDDMDRERHHRGDREENKDREDRDKEDREDKDDKEENLMEDGNGHDGRRDYRGNFRFYRQE